RGADGTVRVAASAEGMAGAAVRIEAGAGTGAGAGRGVGAGVGAGDGAGAWTSRPSPRPQLHPTALPHAHGPSTRPRPTPRVRRMAYSGRRWRYRHRLPLASLRRQGQPSTAREERLRSSRRRPVYLLNPAVSPLISWRRPAMYSTRIGSAESITAASTAGMFTVNSPWSAHSDRGSTRISELWVSTSGNRNPFHTCSAS